MKTRASTKGLLVPSELKTNRLPTRIDVLNYLSKVNRDSCVANKRLKERLAPHIKFVAESVMKMWCCEGIPIVGRARVEHMVRECRDRYLRYMKTAGKKSASPGVRPSGDEWFGKLFDIARCKCADIDSCKCAMADKVPRMEFPFVQDQRGPRQMQIGTADIRETTRRRAMDERRRLTAERVTSPQPGPSGMAQLDSNSDQDSATDSSSLTSVVNESEYMVNSNTDELLNTALAADRYGVSNRACAAIINGFQVDIGRITSDDMDCIVDSKKVWRARDRIRREVVAQSHEDHAGRVSGLYFDGRKDDTLMTASSKKTEEHIVVVSEPDSAYLGHFTPQTGKAEDIFQDLNAVAYEFGADVSVLGCDGTRVNTGQKGGVIRLFELGQKRPVHWFVCQLHANELNLRAVFSQLDGVTTGPKSFSGLIGRAAAGAVETLPVVDFEPIDGGNVSEMTQEILSDLSSDQAILYSLARSVQTGCISDRTAKMKIGPLNHSRWLTLAARILRLYISTEQPSDSLRMLAEFIVCHYTPMWFCIKKNWKCSDGPGNALHSVQLLKSLRPEIAAMVQPVIQRNSYWCHPEAVLLAMAAGQDQATRERAVTQIQQCRRTQVDSDTDEVRKFKLPKVNMGANSIMELIDWCNEAITEPPLTQQLSDDDLLDIIASPLEVPPYPVHSQTVERMVKVVTEASLKVIGEEARHGYIVAKLKHRSAMPVLSSKKDFMSGFLSSM